MREALDDAPLFGGLTGASLGVNEFEVCEGLVLRKTYAHVMSPFLLAFRRPERPGQHHPGPWKATRGGLWLDVEIEVALHRGVRPTGFDRLNTLWWTLALLRLSSGSALRMPVVSTSSFSTIAGSPIEPDLWPVETLPRQFQTVPDPPNVISEEHLRWVRDVFERASELMLTKSAFGRAFQTFDAAIWAHSAGSAIVMIWAALETLIRPGRRNITKNLASSLAAFLEPPGADRDRLFQLVSSLYGARGGSAHASRSPEAQHLMESFQVSRRSFIACLENHELPDNTRLLKKWQMKT